MKISFRKITVAMLLLVFVITTAELFLFFSGTEVTGTVTSCLPRNKSKKCLITAEFQNNTDSTEYVEFLVPDYAKVYVGDTINFRITSSDPPDAKTKYDLISCIGIDAIMILITILAFKAEQSPQNNDHKEL